MDDVESLKSGCVDASRNTNPDNKPVLTETLAETEFRELSSDERVARGRSPIVVND
jgi:hypothetical protein